MEEYKLKKTEAIFFILILTINKIILNLPKLIIKQSFSGAIVNLLYTGLIAIFLAYLISCLFKRFTNHTIIDVSEYLGGKVLKGIISLLYIIFFTMVFCIILLKIVSLIKVVYFIKSPYMYIISFFIVAVIISNFYGFKSIIKTNTLILPVIIFSLFIIFFGVSNSIDVNRIFPILR